MSVHGERNKVLCGVSQWINMNRPVSLEKVAWNWKLFLYINGAVLYFYFNLGLFINIYFVIIN